MIHAVVTDNETKLRKFVRSLVDLPIDVIERVKVEYAYCNNMDGYLLDRMIRACEQHLDIKRTIAGRKNYNPRKGF